MTNHRVVIIKWHVPIVLQCVSVFVDCVVHDCIVDQYNHRVVTCTAVIPSSVCWIDELLCCDHHITTD
jgi:hypothetical protein